MRHLFPGRGTGARVLLAVLALLAINAAGAADSRLALDDLQRVYTQAAGRAAEIVPGAVIAIVDRDGRALLVRRADGSGTVTAAQRAIAVAKAGSAAYLSSNQQAFTTRTAGFIIQQNFPPRVANRPPGPLVGVGFSNLAYSDVNYFREPDGSRIPGTRLYASPGGVPLYKDGVLVAGLGVTGDGTEQEDGSITGSDLDEAVALAGQIGYAPRAEIEGTGVFIDGLSVPYVNSEAKAGVRAPGSFDATGVSAPAAVTWPLALLGGVAGEVHAPIRGDPRAGLIDGQPRLTEAEVRQILANAAARTLVTRAGIRLPAGQVTQVFISVVSNPAQAGQAPDVLGVFRTPDATIFSWDVAVQKARTAVFFSDNTRAFSTRTVGFLAQSMYPPGLSAQPPGPFNGLQEKFSIPLLSGTAGSNPNLPNGMTIFAGGLPLYRNGVLVGAIGVSGDGIDQDDLVAASGTVGFQPDARIRADNFTYLGARLPYAKFPRDAELRPNAGPATSIPAGFAELDSASAQLTELVVNSAATSGDPATSSANALYVAFPAGLAVNSAGDLFIADAARHTISRLAVGGSLTVLAGADGQSGSANATGSAARFNGPLGVLLASDGSLVVADSANGTIRRVTPAGAVTTLAGTPGVRGNTDGAASAASFSLPQAVAQDGSGAFYVADAMNHTIRRISSAGAVSTLAGSAGAAGDTDGTGVAARFNRPAGIAADSAGNLYVADSTNNVIRRITPAGAVTTLAGLSGISGTTDGAGSQALFNNPGGLALDGAGNLILADTGNSTIRRITPAGVVTTVAGLPGVAGLRDGVGGNAWFNQPRAVVVDSAGTIYVADTGNSTIRKITSSGVVSTLTQPAVATTVTTTTPATPTPSPSTPASSGSSSSGGGGAPSGWFVGGLGLLYLLRRCTARGYKRSGAL